MTKTSTEFRPSPSIAPNIGLPAISQAFRLHSCGKSHHLSQSCSQPAVPVGSPSSAHRYSLPHLYAQQLCDAAASLFCSKRPEAYINTIPDCLSHSQVREGGSGRPKAPVTPSIQQAAANADVWIQHLVAKDPFAIGRSERGKTGTC